MRSPPHEAPAGWRDVGADPEFLALICAAHHRQRHEGWLTIEGTASTGRRFYRYGGRELVAKSTAPTVASAEVAGVGSASPKDVARVGNLGASLVDAVQEPPLAKSAAPIVATTEVARVGASEVDAVAQRALRRLELTRAEARTAIQQVRARVAGPLTVDELATLVLRGWSVG